MTFKDTISTLAGAHNITKAKTRRIIDHLIQLIVSDVQHQPVRLPHFGTFKTVERHARVCRNLHTGEPVNVPAKKVIKFKPSKSTEIINV